jgi:hypothetical protein
LDVTDASKKGRRKKAEERARQPIDEATNDSNWVRTRNTLLYLGISAYAGVPASTMPRFIHNVVKIPENIMQYVFGLS